MDRSGLRAGWACLASRARLHALLSKLHLAALHLTGQGARSHDMCGGLCFKVSVVTVISAISQCDGLGWLAVAGSIGFYFARLLGCLSCLPV